MEEKQLTKYDFLEIEWPTPERSKRLQKLTLKGIRRHMQLQAILRFVERSRIVQS